MAEEKKKRFRPTLTEYRALQSELEQLKANLHQTTHELVNTDDDRTYLQAKYDEEVKMLNDELKAFQSSNRYLEDRVRTLEESLRSAQKEIEERNTDILLLKQRSLWQRIINK